MVQCQLSELPVLKQKSRYTDAETLEVATLNFYQRSRADQPATYDVSLQSSPRTPRGHDPSSQEKSVKNALRIIVERVATQLASVWVWQRQAQACQW